VLHAHNPGAAFAAALARRLARAGDTAILTTYHGVMPGRVGRAARVLARTSDLVVAVAPAATDALVAAGLPGGRAATVANAVSPRPARSRDAVREELGAGDRPLVVTVGRYAQEKNQALLLEAVALLDRPVRAVLVGVGPLEGDLRRRVRELGLDGTALVAGERTDAIDLTSAADAFVLTSDWEGLPLAILEALALGTPVVATSVGGIPGAVRHEETGLLVPPRDPRALAAALERLLDEPGLAGRLAAAGRELAAAEYSEATMVGRYVELYSELAAARPSRRRNGARPS
jgi:glycosyltransferase involved in cell wall biosynthesis